MTSAFKWLLSSNIALSPLLPAGDIFDSKEAAIEYAQKQAGKVLRWSGKDGFYTADWYDQSGKNIPFFANTFWLIQVPYHESVTP